MSKFAGFNVKKTNTGLKLIIAAIAAVLFLIIGLGSVVVMDNNKICGEIGLTGFIADTCYGKIGQSFDKVAIVVGNTANTPEPTIREEIQGYITSSLIKSEAEVDIYSVTPDKKKYYVGSSIDEDGSLEDRVEAVQEALGDIKKRITSEPTSSGAQYLEAIMRAAEDMSLEDGEKGVIVVIGSGLSDGGLLDFTNKDYLTSDVTDAIMEKLTKDGERLLPKNLLKNTTIVWSGLGKVVLPQRDLDSNMTTNLQTIYENVLGRNGLGAKKVIFKNGVDNVHSIKTSKTVKTVKVYTDSEKPAVDVYVRFEVDSAEFEDKAQVEQELSEIISDIKLSSDVTIEGYVGLANCNTAADEKLSKKRAEAVKTLLIEKGVSEKKITAVGRGHGPYDECKNGKFNSVESAKNNFVRISYNL